jgi:hypothetical protein
MSRAIIIFMALFVTAAPPVYREMVALPAPSLPPIDWAHGRIQGLSGPLVAVFCEGPGESPNEDYRYVIVFNRDGRTAVLIDREGTTNFFELGTRGPEHDWCWDIREAYHGLAR